MKKLKKIYLKGNLEKFLDNEEYFEINFKSARDAMQCLKIQINGFRSEILNGVYSITEIKDEESVSLLSFDSECGDIIISPEISGSGLDPFEYIAVGALIVGGAYFLAPSIVPGFISAGSGTLGIGVSAGGLGATAFTAFGSAITYGNIALFGTGLALAGLAGLIAPTPKLNLGDVQDSDDKASFLFSGAKNVSAEGIPIPLIYGTCVVGSIVIASGISIDDILDTSLEVVSGGDKPVRSGLI